MTKPTTVDTIRTPAGTYGRAVAPWDETEVYAVAANWAEASSPVLSWGADAWEPTPWQVADCRHDPREALGLVLRRHAGVTEEEVADEVAESVRIDSTSTHPVEVAFANETIRLCGGVDEFAGLDSDTDDACHAYRQAAASSLLNAGYDPVAPRGQRLLHSQWCGAHWSYNAGAIGTMDDAATDADKAAIDAAHEAGLAAARKILDDAAKADAAAE